MDIKYQFDYVSRQFAAYFLGVTPRMFDDYILEIPNIRIFEGVRYRKYNFHDLAKIIKHDATDFEIALMRITANIHYSGVKRKWLSLEREKEK